MAGTVVALTKVNEHKSEIRNSKSETGDIHDSADPLNPASKNRVPNRSGRADVQLRGAAAAGVECVPYRDLDEMHDFTRRSRDDHRGQWFTTAKLSGFCLLLKRAVYDTIGGLDERFGLGFFDDDDLAVRARRAGFDLAVAHDLFIHHFGSRTFAGNGIDTERLLDENAQRFAAKWGHDVAGGPSRHAATLARTGPAVGPEKLPSSHGAGS